MQENSFEKCCYLTPLFQFTKQESFACVLVVIYYCWGLLADGYGLPIEVIGRPLTKYSWGLSITSYWQTIRGFLVKLVIYLSLGHPKTKIANFMKYITLA